MFETITLMTLIGDLLIKLLLIITVSLFLYATIKSMKLDDQKKKEIERLKEQNDLLSNILDTPYKRVREACRENIGSSGDL